MQQPFIHLHVHTQYSVLDGQASVSALVDKAIADGQPALAITDHGNMFGIKEFFNYAKKVNSKTKDAIAKAEAALSKAREEGADVETIGSLQAEVGRNKARLLKPIFG